MHIIGLFDNPVGCRTSLAVFQDSSLIKPHFLAEVVQKLKFPNNSNIKYYTYEKQRRIGKLK
jgi:hypothetical protein